MAPLFKWLSKQYLGLYTATVVNAADPLKLHRVQVTIPSLGVETSPWARTVRDVAGRPKVGDEILVGFEAGNLGHPYVIGVLAAAAPTVSIDAAQWTFSGVVKCQTLIADSVLAQSYSPGLGNMM